MTTMNIQEIGKAWILLQREIQECIERENDMITPADLATEFVDSLDFDTLIAWCGILGVAHDEDQWLDDQRPDKESELRTRVGEAMRLVGTDEKRETSGGERVTK